MISLVTGGTRGIGSTIASVLQSRGDQVYTLSRRKNENDYHISVDLGSKNDVKKIADKLGNILIDNLIFCHRYRGNDRKVEYEISVDSVCEVIEMLEDKFTESASIIIVGSTAGKFVFDEQPVEYHTSRAALESLTKYYAVRLGGQGVRCNCVLPATVIKEENRHFFTNDNPVTKLIVEITPLRNMGEAIDIAHLVEFLCSNKASFITGQCICVDGGLSVVGQESIARRLKGLSHN